MKKEYAHYVVATAIIMFGDRFLIVKRSRDEEAMGSLWGLPGGKLNISDYSERSKNTSHHWHNVLDLVLMRECKEEVGLEIRNIKYIKNLVFLRPDNTPTIVFSFMADFAGGKVTLNHEHEDFAWVDVKEARSFDLIEGLYDELVAATSLKSKMDDGMFVNLGLKDSHVERYIPSV